MWSKQYRVYNLFSYESDSNCFLDKIYQWEQETNLLVRIRINKPAHSHDKIKEQELLHNIQEYLCSDIRHHIYEMIPFDVKRVARRAQPLKKYKEQETKILYLETAISQIQQIDDNFYFTGEELRVAHRMKERLELQKNYFLEKWSEM